MLVISFVRRRILLGEGDGFSADTLHYDSSAARDKEGYGSGSWGRDGRGRGRGRGEGMMARDVDASVAAANKVSSSDSFDEER